MSDSDSSPRPKSAPATLPTGVSMAPAFPSLPSQQSVRTIDNQGTPDPSLGAPDDDTINPDTHRTCKDLVDMLLSPPAKYFNPVDQHGKAHANMVMIRLDWVKRTVSEKHFIYDPSKGLSVLRNDSKIRTNALLQGLPKRYHEWLCGIQVANHPYKATKDQLWIPLADFGRWSFTGPPSSSG